MARRVASSGNSSVRFRVSSNVAFSFADFGGYLGHTLPRLTCKVSTFFCWYSLLFKFADLRLTVPLRVPRHIVVPCCAFLYSSPAHSLAHWCGIFELKDRLHSSVIDAGVGTHRRHILPQEDSSTQWNSSTERNHTKSFFSLPHSI